MNDDPLSSNFEWKKKGFGKKEKLSRRIDANQASVSKAKRKNQITDPVSLAAPSSVSFNHHLKKMRKRVKQALDEEEEDEENENFLFLDPSLMLLDDELDANPLYNGLNEAEKNVIAQNKTIAQIKMQQDASKIRALAAVNAFAQQAGLDSLSSQDLNAHMQNNGWGQDTFKMALEHNISPNIKMGGTQLNTQKIQKLMKGLKRLQKMGNLSAADGMKMSDVIKITDKKFNDEKVAKLLLRKTGRDIDKIEKKRTAHQRRKVSFKTLIQEKQNKQQKSRELS